MGRHFFPIKINKGSVPFYSPFTLFYPFTTYERRAKVIHTEGELQASEKLLQAAQTLAKAPEAMQLRYLQTLSNIAGDKSSTIIFPVPMDLISSLLEALKKRSA